MVQGQRAQRVGDGAGCYQRDHRQRIARRHHWQTTGAPRVVGHERRAEVVSAKSLRSLTIKSIEFFWLDTRSARSNALFARAERFIKMPPAPARAAARHSARLLRPVRSLSIAHPTTPTSEPLSPATAAFERSALARQARAGEHGCMRQQLGMSEEDGWLSKLLATTSPIKRPHRRRPHHTFIRSENFLDSLAAGKAPQLVPAGGDW